MDSSRGKADRTWRNVVIGVVLLLTLLVRIDHAAREVAINPDVIRFIAQAQRLATDPVGAMRDEVYHPLHAALTLAVHWAIVARLVPEEPRAWVISTKVVGIAGAVAVAWVIIRLSRRLGAPWWAAAGAGLLWAVGRRSSGYGADGLSDMLCLALFGFALLAGMSTRLRWRPWSWLAAGVLSGLSYLARPEGVAAVLILGAALVLYYARIRPSRRAGACRHALPGAFSWAECAKCAAVLVLGFAVVASGYMTVIGRFTGKKPLFASASAAARLEVTSDSRAVSAMPEPGRAAESPPVVVAGLPPITGASGVPTTPNGALGRVGVEILETFGFAPCLVVGLAMLLRPRLWGRPHWRMLVLVWIGVWVAVMIWLIHVSGYLDGRHTLVLELALHALFALSLPIWGAPMRWYQNWWRRKSAWATLPGWRRWPGWPALCSGAALLLGCLPGVVLLYVPPAEDRGFIREAAAWIHTHASADAEVVADNPLLGFYSGQAHREAPGDELPQIAATASAQPLILARVYQPGNGERVPRFIGPYVAVQAFVSAEATHGDTLVLYVRPGGGALRASAATQLGVRNNSASPALQH